MAIRLLELALLSLADTLLHLGIARLSVSRDVPPTAEQDGQEGRKESRTHDSLLLCVNREGLLPEIDLEDERLSRPDVTLFCRGR